MGIAEGGCCGYSLGRVRGSKTFKKKIVLLMGWVCYTKFMNEIIRHSDLSRLDLYRDSDLIKVVTGVRRCGKSTLLRQYAKRVIDEGVAPEAIQFYNLEDPAVRGGAASSGQWRDLYDRISTKLVAEQVNYVFIDEPQFVDQFELLLTGLYTNKCVNLYVTGSNAHMLSSDLATLLSGRHVELNLLPFSFAEYCSMRGVPLSESFYDYSALLHEYTFSTSLPAGVALAEKGYPAIRNYVQSVYSTVLEKDIAVRHKIADMRSFDNIFKFILSHIGTAISPGRIAAALKSDGKRVHNQTVERYIEYLCSAFILYKASRYDIKGKAQLATQEKYYLSDFGFRNALLGRDISDDTGHLLENVVYLELLRRGNTVWIGKAGAYEVDFVVQKPDGGREYYQVAYTAPPGSETLQRELRSLLAIADSYPKYLLTLDPGNGYLEGGVIRENVTRWLMW